MNNMEIPNYKLLTKCGRGAYGEVWIAEDSVGRRVALKIVEKSEQVTKEVEGLQAYSRMKEFKYLIRIFHIGEVNSMLYYTMELADNLLPEQDSYIPATLENVLRQKKRFSPNAVRELGMQMLEGLQILHQANLVHRDIKPENILYIDGVPKLSDVGLVRSLSETLSLGGTLGFIPPERLKSSSTNRSNSDDLYALGKVLYCMWSGLDAAKYPSLPPELMDNPQAKALNRAIKTACSRDRACRFKSENDFLHALQYGISPSQRVKHMALRLRYLWGGLSLAILLLLVVWITTKIISAPPPAGKEEERKEPPLEAQIRNRTYVTWDIALGDNDVQKETAAPVDPIFKVHSPKKLEGMPRERQLLFAEGFQSDKWQDQNVENCSQLSDGSLIFRSDAAGKFRLPVSLPEDYSISFDVDIQKLNGKLSFLVEFISPKTRKVRGSYQWGFVGNQAFRQLEMTPLYYRDEQGEERIQVYKQTALHGSMAHVEMMMTKNKIFRIFINGQMVLYSPAFFADGYFSILADCKKGNTCEIKNFRLYAIPSKDNPREEYHFPMKRSAVRQP